MKATAHPKIKQYVDKRTGKPRYLVRYRKPDGAQTMKRGFTTKRDAEQWLIGVEGAKQRGEFVMVSAGRIRIGELAPAWLEGKRTALKPSSYSSLETAWRVHVEPAWGGTAVAAIPPSAVQSWVDGLARERSATVVIRAHGVLRGILDAAVRDRRIVANPAEHAELPRKGRKPSRYLSHVEVKAVAEASTHPVLVYVLAYTGIRWGEAVALQGRHVDRERRRLRIDRSMTKVDGEPVIGTPKSHERRTVPIPAFLLAMLPRVGPDELLFPSERSEYMSQPRKTARREDGSPVSIQWWEKALDAAGVAYMTPHDLRHTAASLAVQSGASVKVVQRMLGHSSAAVTLDVYADLFDSDLDDVAERMDARREHFLNTGDRDAAGSAGALRVIR